MVTEQKTSDSAANPGTDNKERTRSVTFAQSTDTNEDGDDGTTAYGFCNTNQCNLDLKDMILLDNQSIVDLFCNRNLVQTVWRSDSSMTVDGNG